VVVVVVLTALSLATGLVLLALGPQVFGPSSVGADAYSVSAVGHRAFVELLERLDVPVVVSRHRTAERAGPETLLVLLEPKDRDPRPEAEEPEGLGDLVEHGGPVLVVLPKRAWVPDPQHPGWVREAEADGSDPARRVLDRLGLSTPVEVRPAPAAWSVNRYEALPDFPEAVQTIQATPAIEPLVADGIHVLVARVRYGTRVPGGLWLVTDPDLVASHGLHRGENALLVARVLAEARPPGAAVVLDETTHGHGQRPSLWAALFAWPLVLPFLSGLLACLLWVAAGSVRFGAPRPPAAAIPPGSRFLVENSADLLRLGGHAEKALDRYLATALQDVARATHAPAHLTSQETRDWIVAAGRSRRVVTRLEDLEAAVARAGAASDRRHVLAAAVSIHGWREEMTHGPRGDS
jgi:hypothetical protein